MSLDAALESCQKWWVFYRPYSPPYCLVKKKSKTKSISAITLAKQGQIWSWALRCVREFLHWEIYAFLCFDLYNLFLLCFFLWSISNRHSSKQKGVMIPHVPTTQFWQRPTPWPVWPPSPSSSSVFWGKNKNRVILFTDRPICILKRKGFIAWHDPDIMTTPKPKWQCLI